MWTFSLTVRPLTPFVPVDRALRRERGLQELGVDHVQIRVAVGAVHDRLERRVERHRLAADVELKSGVVRLALDAQSARARRRTSPVELEDPADALDGAEIGVLKAVRPAERRRAGIAFLPRTERALRSRSRPSGSDWSASP